jgi:hypothetical protein
VLVEITVPQVGRYLNQVSQYPMAMAILFAEYVYEQPHLLVENLLFSFFLLRTQK